jgi:SAM-dependent methyltransferase
VDSDRAWEQFGQQDPYYGVCTDDRFHAGRLDAGARAEFFASGEEHVHNVLRVVRTQLVPDFTPRRVLDFGCGVGRLVIPFAQRSDEVVGVDISQSMLAEAGVNCAAAGLANVTLTRSDDRLSRVEGRFDLVHSFIVLQHISPARGFVLFDELVRRVEPGGVGVLHLTFARRASTLRKAVNWSRKRIPGVNPLVNVAQRRSPRAPLMQMNLYDLNRVFRRLMAAGCHDVVVRFSDHAGWRGVVLFFVRRPERPW